MDRLNMAVEFLGYWLSYTVALLTLSAIFPSNIVFGSASVSRPIAAIFVSLILTIFVFLVPHFFKMQNYKVKDKRSMVVVFFAIDLVIIWLIKFGAKITGFGVSSIVFVILISAVCSLVYLGVSKVIDSFLRK